MGVPSSGPGPEGHRHSRSATISTVRYVSDSTVRGQRVSSARADSCAHNKTMMSSRSSRAMYTARQRKQASGVIKQSERSRSAGAAEDAFSFSFLLPMIDNAGGQ
jgi:hypothetical protein